MPKISHPPSLRARYATAVYSFKIWSYFSKIADINLDITFALLLILMFMIRHPIKYYLRHWTNKTIPLPISLKIKLNIS